MNNCESRVEENRTFNTYELSLLAGYPWASLVGFIMNVFLIFVIAMQSGQRNRNPLLISLFISDSLVCGLSAPISLYHNVYNERAWLCLPPPWCQILHIIEVNLTDTIRIYQFTNDLYFSTFQ